MLNVLGDRILVEADKPKTMTDSGFYIVEDWKSLPHTGTVLSVGPRVTKVKEGDRVMFERYASIILEGQQRLVLEKHIHARITDE